MVVQQKFGKGGKLEKSETPNPPLARWAKRKDENVKMAIGRRVADAKKAKIFATHPNATFYTFYGDAIIGNRVRRFTFDVDISKLNPVQKHEFIAESWDSIAMSWLPASNYYAVYESPLNLRMAGSIHHNGLIGMLHGHYVKGRGSKGSSSSWTPKLSIKLSDFEIYLQVQSKIRDYRRRQHTRREFYGKQ